MKSLRSSCFILLAAFLQLPLFAQLKSKLIVQPFQNKVFIKEQGQFERNAREQKIPFVQPVLYGVENGEFNAYFTSDGIIFQVPERRNLEEAEIIKDEHGTEKKTIETTWHTVVMRWMNANPSAELIAQEKVSEYYNYGGFADDRTINFVSAYKKIKYINLYPGVDAEFELPEEGGIKYKLFIHPNAAAPDIKFQWEGIENCFTDAEGALHITSLFAPVPGKPEWELLDKAPDAFTASSHTTIPVNYLVTGDAIQFSFSGGTVSSPEGIIIDPWIVNPNYPGLNKAFDIQEDGSANVFVHGNYSETSSGNSYYVQKYNSTGVLQWTYVTYSVFLGDIAVDSPGNTYIIGGYCTGKRQKLDPSGVQQWVQTGLCEEWRLAMNYSKTVLAVCGYFVNPGGNNIAQLDMATGAISNQIAYNEETRSVSTDCNGDMYSLHLPTMTLRKTNANFTPGGVAPSGLSLIYSGTGYAYNPDYSAAVFQGFNGNVIFGNYVYIYDGTLLRRMSKTTLGPVNNVTVPNGVNMLCSGLAADPCGNIYAGTTTSIVQYDSALNYVATIATPGAVYDILQALNGDILACGQNFIGSFSTPCTTPPILTATVSTTPASCGIGGTATVSATGGISPYTYSWNPTGQTAATATNLVPGTYTYTVSDAFCKTYSSTVTIAPIPVTAANFSSTAVCLNVPPTQFTDLSTNATAWTWDFGDGSPASVLQNPSHTYSTSGTFSVSLIASTTSGCPDTLIQVVTVNAIPAANAGADISVCPGFSASLSAGGGVSYAWNPATALSNAAISNPVSAPAATITYTVTVTDGNGCTGTDDVIVTIFPNAIANAGSDVSVCPGFSASLSANGGSGYAWNPATGLSNAAISNPVSTPVTTTTYTVTVTDANSCTATDDVIVTIYPNAVANAGGDVSICTGSSASLSASGGSGYAWNPATALSNAAISNPVSAPAATITYTVTVTDANGCTDTDDIIVTVNPKPTANYFASTVCFNNPTVFTDQSSVTVTQWEYDFGDGSPLNTAQNPSHTYNTSGTFITTLIVTTADGCKDTATVNVTVNPLPSVNFYSDTVCKNFQTCFTDMTTIVSGTITAWNWNFGDPPSGPANISNVQNPCHTYTASGTYPVVLTVGSSNNCQSTIMINTPVLAPPVAGFAAPTACLNTSTVFTDASAGATGWYWQFGDGGTSNVQNPVHTYSGYGTYVVTLIVSAGGATCADTLQDTVQVNALPVVNFSHDTVCFGDSTSFTDLSYIPSGTIAQWNWNFGDASSSSAQNPVHAYSAGGTYNVTLTCTSNNNCPSQLTLPVLVYPLPLANFSTAPSPNALLTDSVTFTDLSTGGVVDWQWSFGDSTFDTAQFPQHLYTDTGTYVITLIVETANGCIDTVQKIFRVEDYAFYIPNAFTPNGDDRNDFFFGSGIGITDYEMWIFDRWGNTVFYCTASDSPQNAPCRWDGKVKGGVSNERIQEDVYVWKVRLNNVFQEEYNFVGTVTVVR